MMKEQPVFRFAEEDDVGKILFFIRELAAYGCLALVVLHDPALALNLCDRVLILQEGRVTKTLDLQKADDAHIEEAMRALYGEVSLVRGRDGLALLPDGGP